MATPAKPKKAYNLQEAIGFEKRLLSWWGLYPICESSGLDKVLFYVRSFLSFLHINVFALSMWLNVPLNIKDPSVVIETLYYALIQVTFMCKLYNIHIRKDKYKRLLEYLDREEFNDYNEEQFGYVKDAAYLSLMFSRAFRSAVTVAMLFYLVFPFFDTGVALPSYFPIDIESNKRLIYVFQNVGIGTNGFCQSSLDILMATLISLGSAQFEILKNNLTNFRHGLDDDIEKRDDNDKICKQRLKKYVEHHVILINYVYELEDLFSFVQFVQFLIASVIMCVTGYQMLITSFTDIKFLALGLYFCCNLVQISMCCWFGQDIMTKSETVGDACYMSDWYNSGPSVCRVLFIIMERAKRPMKLTAGKFFEISLQTLMQVLKTSYSYLTLLKRMNEVKEF